MRETRGDSEDNFYLRGLVNCVRWVAHWPRIALALALACVLAATLYSSGRLRMNSDNRQLVRQDAPFRQNYTEYLEAFPEFEDTTLIVLTSGSIDTAEDAQRRLSAALRERTDVVASVYAPGADPFFEDHALLYLDTDDLDRVTERLAEAQPALAALVNDPSLRGLLGQLQDGVESLAESGSVAPGFGWMADRVAEIAESMLSGDPRAVSWSDELLDHSGTEYRLITVQGRQDFDQSIPSERLIDEIRSTANRIGVTPAAGVTLRLTGMVPLAHEELVSLRQGIVLSSVVSLTLLVFILSVGLRSLRIFAATIAALVTSLSLTTAWAMFSVGELNTLSAAFAVLLIGLGVDFGIHIGLRCNEETTRGVPVIDALERATTATGLPISLCALTSAIGFASFVPTEYSGLAALGVIAAGGMFVSLVASFTVLPAVLSWSGLPKRPRSTRSVGFGRLYGLIDAHAGVIVSSAAVFAVFAAGLSYHKIAFDFSTLGLKDPASESMTTLSELHREDIVTDYSVTALSPDLASAESLARELEALELVDEVQTPFDFVPSDQEEKLAMLEDAAFFLEPVINPASPLSAPTREERVASIDSILTAMSELPDDAEAEALASSERLAAALRALIETDDPASRAAELERLAVADVAEQVEWLRRALGVGAVTFEDLPDDLQRRLVSSDGRARVVALPLEDVSDVAALRQFVDAVVTVAPKATGRPVVEAGVGAIVVRSFRLAIIIALAAILVVLLLTLRRISDSLLVLAPITLAALFTVTIGILTGTHFNMANVIAIPLVLGLGIDSGIHVFMRFRSDASLSGAVASSTPRAVVLSALTTLAAFGSLSLSSHRGFSSLGVLLSVSVVGLLYTTLVVLPAMIIVRARAGKRNRLRCSRRVRE